MEELYIIIDNKKEEISKDIIRKYNLEVGDLTPFTRKPIVNEHEFTKKETKPKTRPDLSYSDDAIAEMDNGLSLSTSEILDIASGADSDESEI